MFDNEIDEIKTKYELNDLELVLALQELNEGGVI